MTMVLSNDNYKVEQKAQNPGPQGRGQDQQYSTHEGSQLGSPTKPHNKQSRTPHV